MIDDVFVGSILSVTRLPGQVCLIGFFISEHISELAIIASIKQEMTMAEAKVSRKGECFKRPSDLVEIFPYLAWLFGIPTRVNELIDKLGIVIQPLFCIINFAIFIHKIFWFIAWCIGCNDWVLTCIATVELFDTLDIPVLLESMVAIYLHLVRFVLEMTLTHKSWVVNIQGVFNIDSFH